MYEGDFTIRQHDDICWRARHDISFNSNWGFDNFINCSLWHDLDIRVETDIIVFVIVLYHYIILHIASYRWSWYFVSFNLYDQRTNEQISNGFSLYGQYITKCPFAKGRFQDPCIACHVSWKLFNKNILFALNLILERQKKDIQNMSSDILIHEGDTEETSFSICLSRIPDRQRQLYNWNDFSYRSRM